MAISGMRVAGLVLRMNAHVAALVAPSSERRAASSLGPSDWMDVAAEAAGALEYSEEAMRLIADENSLNEGAFFSAAMPSSSLLSSRA